MVSPILVAPNGRRQNENQMHFTSGGCALDGRISKAANRIGAASGKNKNSETRPVEFATIAARCRTVVVKQQFRRGRNLTIIRPFLAAIYTREAAAAGHAVIFRDMFVVLLPLAIGTVKSRGLSAVGRECFIETNATLKKLRGSAIFMETKP